MVYDPSRGGAPKNPLTATITSQYQQPKPVPAPVAGMMPPRQMPNPKPVLARAQTPQAQAPQPALPPLPGNATRAGDPKPGLGTSVNPGFGGQPHQGLPTAVPGSPQPIAVGEPNPAAPAPVDDDAEYSRAWDQFDRMEAKIADRVEQARAAGYDIPEEKLAELQAHIARLRERRLGREQEKAARHQMRDERRAQHYDARMAHGAPHGATDYAAQLAERRRQLMEQYSAPPINPAQGG